LAPRGEDRLNSRLNPQVQLLKSPVGNNL
jgi:hypothetical protein